jgi:cell wall-associated NlpC family hydrolase
VPAGAALEPGDLVFFGAGDEAVEHVGILVSPTEMVDAPHTGAVVRVESFAWPDYLGATRPGA